MLVQLIRAGDPAPVRELLNQMVDNQRDIVAGILQIEWLDATIACYEWCGRAEGGPGEKHVEGATLEGWHQLAQEQAAALVLITQEHEWRAELKRKDAEAAAAKAGLKDTGRAVRRSP